MVSICGGDVLIGLQNSFRSWNPSQSIWEKFTVSFGKPNILSSESFPRL